MISVGNSKGSRETEKFFELLLMSGLAIFNKE